MILNYFYCGYEWNRAKAWTKHWMDSCTPTHYFCYPSASGTSGRKTVPCVRTVIPLFKRHDFFHLYTYVDGTSFFLKTCFVFDIIAWMSHCIVLICNTNSCHLQIMFYQVDVAQSDFSTLLFVHLFLILWCSVLVKMHQLILLKQCQQELMLQCKPEFM